MVEALTWVGSAKHQIQRLMTTGVVAACAVAPRAGAASAAFCTIMALLFGGISSMGDEFDHRHEQRLREAYERQLTEDELVPLNHVLYRLYDDLGELLYVGITSDVVARMAGHRADKWWWDQVDDKQFEYFETRGALEAAERLAIIREKPRYNIAHQPDRPTQSKTTRATTRSRPTPMGKRS